MKKHNKLISNIFLIATFLGAIVTFLLIELLPINLNSAQVFDKHATLFNPANYTYYIWILIALLQLLYILFANKVFKYNCLSNNAIIITNSFAGLFNLLAIGWIITLHFELIFVSALITVLMGVVLYLLCVNIKNLKPTDMCSMLSIMPFLAISAWITFLSSTNLYMLYVNVGLVPNLAVWAIVNLALTTIIAIITAISFNSLEYLIIFIWAYVGILVRHLTTFKSVHLDMVYSTVVAIFLLILAMIFIIYNMAIAKRKTKRKLVD